RGRGRPHDPEHGRRADHQKRRGRGRVRRGRRDVAAGRGRGEGGGGEALASLLSRGRFESYGQTGAQAAWAPIVPLVDSPGHTAYTPARLERRKPCPCPRKADRRKS